MSHKARTRQRVTRVKWKDLATDLNLVPSSLNVERIDEDSGLARLIKAVSPATDVSLAGRVQVTGLGKCREWEGPAISMNLSSRKNTWNSLITVHGGFLSAYDSIKQQIFMLLDAITESGSEEDPWRVYVTGHSLGGALATLCAYELATRRGPARARQRISMYSFGAPRAGNKVRSA
eukprot:432320-Pelagomonas_calceolata.AAC.4